LIEASSQQIPFSADYIEVCCVEITFAEVTGESRSTSGLQKKYPGLLMHSSMVSSIGAD